MIQIITKLLSLILDSIFPKACFGCDSTGSYFCDECIKTTPRQNTQRCIVCQKLSLAGLTHPKCKNTITPDQLITIFNYNQRPIKQLIIAGKYRFVKDIFILFGNILATELNIDRSFTICEIPLSRGRQNWRGFNQTKILAEQLSRLKSIECLELLNRHKHTRVQKDLSKQEREFNLRNAFSINKQAMIPDRVIVIDDVTTSGTTFLEAAKALKRAGAKFVWCIAIAQD